MPRQPISTSFSPLPILIYIIHVQLLSNRQQSTLSCLQNVKKTLTVYVAVPCRKRTLFQNAITEINVTKIYLYLSPSSCLCTTGINIGQKKQQQGGSLAYKITKFEGKRQSKDSTASVITYNENLH